jgi:hypothetical protein
MPWDCCGLCGIELVFSVHHQVVELLKFSRGETLQLENRRVFEIIKQVLFAFKEPLVAFEETDLQVERILSDE